MGSDTDVGPKTYMWNFTDLPLTTKIWPEYNGALDADDPYTLYINPYSYVELWDYVYSNNLDSQNSDIKSYVVSYVHFGPDASTTTENFGLKLPLTVASQSERAAEQIGDKHYDDSNNVVNIFFGMHNEDKFSDVYCMNVPYDDNVWTVIPASSLSPYYYSSDQSSISGVQFNAIQGLDFETSSTINSINSNPSYSVNWTISTPYQRSNSVLNDPRFRASHVRAFPLINSNGDVVSINSEWEPTIGSQIVFDETFDPEHILHSITI